MYVCPLNRDIYIYIGECKVLPVHPYRKKVPSSPGRSFLFSLYRYLIWPAEQVLASAAHSVLSHTHNFRVPATQALFDVVFVKFSLYSLALTCSCRYALKRIRKK